MRHTSRYPARSCLYELRRTCIFLRRFLSDQPRGNYRHWASLCQPIPNGAQANPMRIRHFTIIIEPSYEKSAAALRMNPQLRHVLYAEDLAVRVLTGCTGARQDTL